MAIRLLSLMLICVVVALLLGAGYIGLFLPNKQAAPVDTVIVTPELVERGRYLAENVVLCSDCHSERDWRLFGGPRKEPVGIGRECITDTTPVAGIITSEEDNLGVSPAENHAIKRLCIPNITPHKTAGIGAWTDGEIIRAMREGIDRHGKGLFPIMPYFVLRHIADEDAKAIVAYLRSLPPIDHHWPDRQIDFPMSLLPRLWPEPLTQPVAMPDPADTVAQGRYLATIARCYFCHTPRSRFGKQSIDSLMFSGGVPFAINDLVLYSNNLTPDKETGIGDWSRDKFIQFFKKHQHQKAVAPEDNTLMNWNAYAGMTVADLGAIYDYLQTVPAISNAKRDRLSREAAF